MPKTCENWLSLLKSCIYYAHQTCEISKLPGRFEILWVRQYSVNKVSILIKDL